MASVVSNVCTLMMLFTLSASILESTVMEQRKPIVRPTFTLTMEQLNQDAQVWILINNLSSIKPILLQHIRATILGHMSTIQKAFLEIPSFALKNAKKIFKIASKVQFIWVESLEIRTREQKAISSLKPTANRPFLNDF